MLQLAQPALALAQDLNFFLLFITFTLSPQIMFTYEMLQVFSSFFNAFLSLVISRGVKNDSTPPWHHHCHWWCDKRHMNKL